MGATIAVIGLGRIGAFHAETLAGWPVWTNSSSPTNVPR